MKEKTDLIQNNIKNLTSLWATVGASFKAYYKTPDFEYCQIKDSEWPNRLWLHKPITQEGVGLIKEKSATFSTNITLPIWNVYNHKKDVVLEDYGFTLKFEQVGMFLKPDKYFNVKDDVKIKRVTGSIEAKTWSKIFMESFGYLISFETVIKTLKNVNYYLAYHDGVAIGTAILHKTGNTIGVHSVGIPPEDRRRGYAEQIMRLLINIAIENQNEYIVLQASNMGKGLYLKLGFKEQFVIKNYVLNSCIK